MNVKAERLLGFLIFPNVETVSIGLRIDEEKREVRE